MVGDRGEEEGGGVMLVVLNVDIIGLMYVLYKRKILKIIINSI